MLQRERCRVAMIVTLGGNERNGVESPQGTVENWEVSEIKDNGANEENWMDLF